MVNGDVPVVEGFTDLVEVGRGGFSRVYAAYQVAFDRRVAIKVLNDRLADDESVAAFERECQAMGALSRHPFIVTVLASAFTSDYRPCIVMDLFERGNYMQLVRRKGPLPLEELLSVGVRVAGALATAHQDGVIHGDVKPQNIFKSAFGFPALGDFGIATLRNRAAERVGLGMSPHFVAPELIEEGAAAAAAAADQYSLGATLFTLATGRRPFESDSPQAPQQILARALEAPTPALPDGFSAEVAAALRRAMAREPRDRFPDLGAFAVAFANIEYRLGFPPTAIPIAGIDDDTTIAFDKDTLAALRRQATVPTTPAAPTGQTPETDAATTVLAPPRQPPDQLPPDRSPPEPPKRRRRTLLASLAVLLAAAAVTAYFVTRDGTPSATAPEPIPPESPQPPPAPQAPPATEPTRTPEQTAGTVQPPPEPAAPAPAAEPAPPPPPQPASTPTPSTEPSVSAAVTDPPTPPPAPLIPEAPTDDDAPPADQPEPAAPAPPAPAPPAPTPPAPTPPAPTPPASQPEPDEPSVFVPTEEWLGTEDPVVVTVPSPELDPPGVTSIDVAFTEAPAGGVNQVSASWSASSDSPITRWAVDDGGLPGSPESAATRHTWSDVPAGTYTIRVQACNDAGCGLEGSATVTVTDPRSVLLTKGRQRNVPGCTSANCHFLRVELVNFEPGDYNVYCMREGDPVEWEDYETSETVSEFCIWGYDASVYVVVEDPRTGERVTSNDARWP